MTLNANPTPAQQTEVIGNVLRRMTRQSLREKLPPSSTPQPILYSDQESAEEYSTRLSEALAARSAAPGVADTSCPHCGGLGFVSADAPVGDPDFGKLLACGCTAADRAQRLQKLCGLTSYERSVTLSSIKVARPGSQTDHMVRAAGEFLAHPRGILTISGTNGNGKSMALWAIVNGCLAANIEAVYITYQRLLDYIRDAYHDDDKASARLGRFQSVRVLCIDEFGHDKNKATDWVLSQESALIDWRYRHGLAGLSGTVIAMNDNIHDLPADVRSRLLDGRNQHIVNNDPDVRSYLRS